MSRKVVALDVMLRASEEMARAGHGVEHVLVGRIRGRVEGDREAVGDGGLGHGRIIQPAGRGLPFKTVGFGVEYTPDESAGPAAPRLHGDPAPRDRGGAGQFQPRRIADPFGQLLRVPRTGRIAPQG